MTSIRGMMPIEGMAFIAIKTPRRGTFSLPMRIYMYKGAFYTVK
jgi:hypothetical protein